MLLPPKKIEPHGAISGGHSAPTLLDFERLGALPDWLFSAAAGGIAISGDSGTGKSSLLAAMATLFAKQEIGFSLYDPAADLYRLVKNICLDLGPSVRRRTYLISPAGMKGLCFSIRPLFVNPANLTPDEYEARLVRRVSIAARVLLTAFGDGTNFDSKPLLAKWVTRVLEAAASLGLSFVDGEIFLQVGSELYTALVPAVPDFVARIEFEELMNMRPTERENFIASTKNRYLGLLKNPLVRNFLCGRASAVNARTIADLIKSNAIMLWDLSPHGKLRPEDQQILCNTALSEAMDAIENFDEHERTPHILMCDELPTFLACPSTQEQLTHLLRTCRKTLLRCVGAFQGVNFFPDKTEDRALHAFIGQCGTLFAFRHKDPVDAKFWAEIIKLPTMRTDMQMPKHVLVQEQQYQDGNDIAILVDQGENESLSDGRGGGQTWGRNQQQNWQDTHSRATSDTEGSSHAVSDTTSRADALAEVRTNSLVRTRPINAQYDEDVLRQAVSRAEAEARGQVQGSTRTGTESAGHTDGRTSQKSHSASETMALGRGGAEGSHHDQNQNWSKQEQHGRSRTLKQTLIPRIKWREVVTAVQFYTPEEHLLLEASDFTRKAVGEAILYHAGQVPVLTKIGLVRDPYELTPKFGAKEEAEFMEDLANRPEYQSPEAIKEERDRFLTALLAEVNALAWRQSQARRQGAVTQPPAKDCDTLPIIVKDNSPLGI